MKFGETFTEYLQTNQERFLEKCCHVEYKRLKKVLKSCRKCRVLKDSTSSDNNSNVDSGDDDTEASSLILCQYEPCPLCDKKFFSELMKEASDIAGCLSSRARRLRRFHFDGGMQRYLTCVRFCFASSPEKGTAQQCRMLMEYVMMNAVAMRKILKKYDKVHGSVNGRKFKSKMREEHIEILQSPWLIELGAFYINSNESISDQNSPPVCFDLDESEPKMTLLLPDSVKLEYNLTCAICLELVFNPCALSCGHLFCKLCACSAASVMFFQGLKAASHDSKCPVCREAGVYGNAVEMLELDLLLRKFCKDYWKERLVNERMETVKQSKAYWDLQARYMIGY